MQTTQNLGKLWCCNFRKKKTELKLNAYEILALAGELRKEGINISTKIISL